MKFDIRSALILSGFGLALVSGLLLAFSGPGSRLGLWNFRAGFSLLKWAMFGGLASLVLCAAGLFLSLHSKTYSGLYFAGAGLLIGLVIAVVPLNARRTADSVPRINDITTDTQEPPEFSALPAPRAGADTPAVYGGQEIAAQQLKAYPQVKPVILQLPPAEAFEKALATAKALGWEITAADKPAGRIEAVDTTFWFGFKDDIVIRVRAEGNGSRLDIRSRSRVGKSDLGTNAKRIMKFSENMLPRK